jgi:hypothetical protein
LFSRGGACLGNLRNGELPEFVEIYVDPEPYGITRTPSFYGSAGKDIAAAGFAVELWLYNQCRLVDAEWKPVTEHAFIQEAIGQNASADKIKFFEKDKSNKGFWTEVDDVIFMKWGQRLSSLLDIPFIEELATALLAKR